MCKEFESMGNWALPELSQASTLCGRWSKCKWSGWNVCTKGHALVWKSNSIIICNIEHQPCGICHSFTFLFWTSLNKITFLTRWKWLQFEICPIYLTLFIEPYLRKYIWECHRLWSDQYKGGTILSQNLNAVSTHLFVCWTALLPRPPKLYSNKQGGS